MDKNNARDIEERIFFGFGRSGLRLAVVFLLGALLVLADGYLRLMAAFGEPDLVMVSEASRSDEGSTIAVRVRVAGFSGGRSDRPYPGSSGKTALEIAGMQSNVSFLSAGVKYSSDEHIEKVFYAACRRRDHVVMRELAAYLPRLACPPTTAALQL